MTDIFKKLQEDIIKLAKSQETDFLPLIKSVYGDTSDAVLEGAVFANYIYENDSKEREKILLECDGELRAKKSSKHIKKFNEMFPKSETNQNITTHQKRINSVWAKAEKIRGENPDIYRKDSMGNKIRYGAYGQRIGSGWEMHHIIPLSKGGGDTLSNLQPLQWEENRMKYNDTTNKVTMAVIKEIYPIAREVSKKRKTLTGGVNQLVEEVGMNKLTATIYIRFFVKLKKGKPHNDKLAVNLMAASYFLEKILADDGKDGLKVALESLGMYIENIFRGGNLAGLKRIHAEFSKKL